MRFCCCYRCYFASTMVIERAKISHSDYRKFIAQSMHKHLRLYIFDNYSVLNEFWRLANELLDSSSINICTFLHIWSIECNTILWWQAIYSQFIGVQFNRVIDRRQQEKQIEKSKNNSHLRERRMVYFYYMWFVSCNLNRIHQLFLSACSEINKPTLVLQKLNRHSPSPLPRAIVSIIFIQFSLFHTIHS